MNTLNFKIINPKKFYVVNTKIAFDSESYEFAA